MIKELETKGTKDCADGAKENGLHTLLRATNRDRLGCRNDESETGLAVQLRPSQETEASQQRNVEAHRQSRC